MLIPILIILAIILAPIAVWFCWRLVSGHTSLPCPTSFAGLVQNPFTSGYHARALSSLDLSPGLHVLDAGCGPGLLTTAIAAAVSPNGRVLAVDIQPGMISNARARAEQAGLSNVDYLVTPLGAGRLPVSRFDRAVLVTVLGEIPDRVAALGEIRTSLNPGGFLSITEVLPDPHYQSMRKILALAELAGLRFRNKSGNIFAFTVNLERPLGP